MPFYKNKSDFHFRHHISTGHNKLIVGEDKEKYYYLNVTHSEKRDKTHKNNKFKINPKPNDFDPLTKKIRTSYYERRILNDKKTNFKTKKIKNWKLSKQDLIEIEKILKNKKNSP